MRIKRSDLLEVALGFAIVAVLAFIVFFGLSRVYSIVVPAPESGASIAMAAYFEPTADKDPRLRVSGVVLEHGKPLADGRARVTVRRLNDASQQSVSVVVKDGKFETADQIAFRDYSNRDRLNVQTDVSKADTALLAREETYLNAFPPLAPGSVRNALIVLALISVVFFWSFTGVATAGKNQAAIIFSYCVMILFLALPFMAFYVLGRYQSVAQVAMDVAGSTPVGVLPAVPMNDSDGKPATGVEREWVLNIGGIVVDRPQAAAVGQQQTETRTGGNQSADASGAPQSAEAGNRTTLGIDAVSNAPNDQKVEGARMASRTQQNTRPPQYAIEGGLVIPLYVLILSIIGGAINMTRMLPVYQREAQSLVSPHQWFHAIGAEVLKRTLRASESPNDDETVNVREVVAAAEAAAGANSNEQGQVRDGAQLPLEAAPEGTNVTIVTTQAHDGQAALQPQVQVSVRQPTAAAQEPTDSHKLTTQHGANESAANGEPGEAPKPSKTTQVTVGQAPQPMTAPQLAAVWRQGLITQHMYLLSAPFLAIAVFYLLDWLDLRKKALLVLASFSVGLISDKILSAILSVVEPVLKGASSDATKVEVKSADAGK